MDNNEFRAMLIDKGVITKNGKKKHNWKDKYDKECDDIFKTLKTKYRSDDEAFFCIQYGIEPHVCDICGNELSKFTGSRKSLYFGYNCNCSHCSSNASPIKKEKMKNTISSHTLEQKE